MANLLSWAGQRLKDVEAQINPFDNGATYSNPNPQPRPQTFNTGGLTVNNQPNRQQVSVNNAPPAQAPLRVAPPVQLPQINVPHYTGPGMYSWSKPPAYQLPNLGTPGGGGINVGHFLGSGAIENFLNAPEQIANTISAKQAGLINTKQALGDVGGALLNSAGWALPVGKGAELAKGVEGKLATRAIQSAKTFGKVGAGFGTVGGAMNAMGQNASPLDIAKSAAISGVIGYGTGALTGGALPVAGAGARLAGKGAVKTADAVKPHIDPALLQERNKWVGTYSNAKDPAIKSFADRKITEIDHKIDLAREGGFVKIPGGKNVNKPIPPELDPNRALNTIKDYHDVLNGNKPSAVVANITPELSARIKNEAGLTVKPNTPAEIIKSHAVHIEARHGVNSTDPNPINDQAIGSLPYVLENPDKISRGASVRGAPRIRIERQLDHNKVGVVEITKKGDKANVVTYFNDSPSSRPDRLAQGNRQDIRAGRSQSANLSTNIPNEAGFVKIPGKPNVPEVAKGQPKLTDQQILKGFADVRSKFPNDKAFYEQFVLPEAEKNTRSADLAQEIVGQVENDGLPHTAAIDNSIKPDLPPSPHQGYYDARNELAGIASRNKQPQLIKQFDQISKGMSVEEKTALLNKSLMDFRNKGGGLIELGAKFDDPNAEKGLVRVTQPTQGVNLTAEQASKLTPKQYQKAFSTSKNPLSIEGARLELADLQEEPPDFLKPTGNSSKSRSNPAGSRNYNRGSLKKQSLPLSIRRISSEQELPKKQSVKSADAETQSGFSVKNPKATTKNGAKSSSTNFTTNPTKVNIPDVKPGDYEQVRANAQLSSSPVQYAAGQVARTARSLKLSTARLGGLVEGTIKPASSAEKEAIRRYRIFADRVHATSQALGGKTPYRANYFHHEWDLSNPEDATRFEQFRQRKFGQELNPSQFEGLDTQPRVFNTVKQGLAAGFKLKEPTAATDILDYGNKSAYALRQQALGKGLQEADINEELKPHSFDVGSGKTIALSDKGLSQIRGFEKSKPVQSPILKGYRAANRGLKRTLLSASEFHPINITKKVAPGLALEGHPVLAAKGAYGAFRAQIGRAYSDKLQQSALEDGTVDFGARVGSPIKFGTDYTAEGRLTPGKEGFGEKTIFEKSMPALHIRALQALKSDLDKKGISYNSPEARAAGTRINEMMGFVNTEFRNLDKSHQKFLSDVALAPQFTRAKWATIKSALKDTRLNNKSLAGSYARRAVIGDTLATATAMLGLGYLAKQKSDNIKDLLIRALVHPSVPTPFKDSKGNNIELGMPSTYTSEALGLVANITRGKDGHLSINFSPANLPGNVGNYGRARLALLPGDALKVATNTDFANKPLYDPNAPLGTKAIQSATTLLTGNAPIGLQGAAETNLIKSHLPQTAQDVLTADTPGSNPLIKSIGSSFGLTPRTDKTVGKGLQTTQYFNALAAAGKGLNHQEQDALDLYTGGKKNPVTGQYEIPPTANDSRAKAVALLQNPKVIDHLITMNQSLKNQGQSVDPLWDASKAQITKYLQYQAMPPAGPDKTDWYNKNQSWYAPLAKQRDAFFNTLPPGDPNKPKLNIQYPTPSPAVQNALNTYGSLTNSTAKGNYLDQHPEIIKQWDAVANYNNQMRQAQGYAPLKNYPEASSGLQNFMNQYSSADKTTRQAIRNSNPQQYQNMIAYFDSVDLYNNNKQGAVSALQGEPDYTSSQAKSISNLAQDIYQNPDGSYSIVPAGWMNGLSNGSSYSSSGPSVKTQIDDILNAQKKADAAIKPPKPPKAPGIKLAYKTPALKKQPGATSGFAKTSRISVKKHTA